MMDLIARLEAAAGGSQALTDDTLRALGFVTKRYPMDSDRYWIVPGDERHPLPPWCDKITVSLDAALALAERVLPEETFWEMNHSAIIQGKRMFYAEVFPPKQEKESSFWGHSSSEAMSMCIAILKAKLAEEPTKG